MGATLDAHRHNNDLEQQQDAIVDGRGLTVSTRQSAPNLLPVQQSWQDTDRTLLELLQPQSHAPHPDSMSVAPQSIAMPTSGFPQTRSGLDLLQPQLQASHPIAVSSVPLSSDRRGRPEIAAENESAAETLLMLCEPTHSPDPMSDAARLITTPAPSDFPRSGLLVPQDPGKDTNQMTNTPQQLESSRKKRRQQGINIVIIVVIICETFQDLSKNGISKKILIISIMTLIPLLPLLTVG